ncbi:hypothetical protein DFQ11_101626 [Winogradskyella epiphytica]|uniref:Uncharacterized protein n=1 Tax=Winogradskyella epiphytica TaxID=262005 RepID=A0A2V4XAW4_9FLAO|nr:hypothetical protein [Winogradskyella epiphytica]PYE83195.1 hypothetical protein DFQ11_101626 [Winogradskyella epiphytica]GGW56492.1 hypothetical protein GCM10008085_04910 [Winogradskyella epiphytica]
MKYIKTTVNTLLFTTLMLTSGCRDTNEDKNLLGEQSNELNEQNKNADDIRISTYEFHISGGDFDGQSFTGEFPNNGEHGSSSFSSKKAKNIEDDMVRIHFKDKTKEGMTLAAELKIALNTDGKAYAISDFSSAKNDIKQSSIIFMLFEESEDNGGYYQFSNTSGTINLTNLKLDQETAQYLTSTADCDVEFDAVFRAIQMFNTGEAPKTESVKIKGVIHMQSIEGIN